MKDWTISKAEVLNDGKILEVTFVVKGEITRMTLSNDADFWYNSWLLHNKLEEARAVNNHLAEINKEYKEAFSKQLINCKCRDKINEVK